MTSFDDVAAFPLCWPDGWPRSASQIDSRFKVNSVYDATQNLSVELERMGATGIVLSTSIPLRKDGLPLSRPPIDGDVGAAVYFIRKGKPLCLACDQYFGVEDNIHALAKTIEAMRGIERWGSTDLLDRAFTGFAALPSRANWRDILGIGASATLDQAEKAYRRLALNRHPDRGGTQEQMAELNGAITEARSNL